MAFHAGEDVHGRAAAYMLVPGALQIAEGELDVEVGLDPAVVAGQDVNDHVHVVEENHVVHVVAHQIADSFAGQLDDPSVAEDLEGEAWLVVAELASAFEDGKEASEEAVEVGIAVVAACPVAVTAYALDAAAEEEEDQGWVVDKTGILTQDVWKAAQVASAELAEDGDEVEVEAASA